MMKISRTLHNRRGSASMLMLVIMLIATVTALALFQLSLTNTAEAYRASQKDQATALADAGLNDLYNQYVTAKLAGSNPPSTVTSSLSSTFAAGGTQTDGSYTASITQPVTATTIGGTAGFQVVIQSIGTAPDGQQSIVNAVFVYKSGSSGGSFTFPNGSIVSNGPVSFGSSGTSMVDISNSNQAGIWANGNVNIGNNASVAGTVYTETGFSTTNTGTITGTPQTTSGPAIPFPTMDMMNTWNAYWQTVAQQGWSGLPANVPATVTPPLYINGSFSGNVTITPNSDPTKNIVYVNGDVTGTIKTLGTSATNAITVVSTGQYSGNLLAPNGPQTATLVIQSNQADALYMTNHSSVHGLCLLEQGGATFTNPQVDFLGELIVCGTAGVSGGNGSGNATLKYPGGTLGSTVMAFPQLAATFYGISHQYSQTQ